MANVMDWNFDDDERRVHKILKEEEGEFDKPAEAELDVERDKKTSSTLSRMSFEWQSDDRAVIRDIQRRANYEIVRTFSDAYDVLWDIYARVRDPVMIHDENGEYVCQTDENGEIVWKTDESGKIIENWTNIIDRDREEYILRITTYLVDMHQRAHDIWLEAMIAKGKWEEVFSRGFVSSKGTNDARMHEGKSSAIQERYHALYLAALSRKAEALVKSFELLGQRLKDTYI